MKANNFFVAFHMAALILRKKKHNIVCNKKQAAFSNQHTYLSQIFQPSCLFQLTHCLLFSKTFANPSAYPP